MAEQVSDEAVEAAFLEFCRYVRDDGLRDRLVRALEAAAPFIRAQAEREHRASALEEMADSYEGQGFSGRFVRGLRARAIAEREGGAS